MSPYSDVGMCQAMREGRAHWLPVALAEGRERGYPIQCGVCGLFTEQDAGRRSCLGDVRRALSPRSKAPHTGSPPASRDAGSRAYPHADDTAFAERMKELDCAYELPDLVRFVVHALTLTRVWVAWLR